MGSIKVAAAFVKSGLPSGSLAAEEDAAGEGEETSGGVEPGVAEGGFPGGGGD